MSLKQIKTYSKRTRAHQLVEVLPVVLHHEPEQGQERPPKAIETGVAIIRIVAKREANETALAVSMRS